MRVMSATIPVGESRERGRAMRVRPRTAAWLGSSALRKLQVTLAVLWLLDAALQYQPYMFTRRFVTTTFVPVADSNPGVIAHSVNWAAHLIAHHVAVYDATFATLQLLLAVGILWPRTVRAALGLSIVWSGAVWWFGEGLGGVFATGTSPFMGAPGAVILYALLAVLVWPDHRSEGPSVATSGPVGATMARWAWLALWASGAFFAIQPGARSPDALSQMVTGAADGEPGWIQALDRGLGRILAGHGTEVSLGFAAVFAFVGLSVFLRRRPARVGAALAAVCGLVIWATEGFGAIFTGHGTDPNSGLLLVVLAAAYWPDPGRPAD